jgi:D-methionine transport system permease protein
VLIPEALPSLVSSATTTVVALIGSSAMAGTVGAGGLAVRYGYERFETELMWITVAVLAVVISAIQFPGDFTARALHRRRRSVGAAPRLRLLRAAVPAATPAAPTAPTKTSGNEPRQQPATGSAPRENDFPRA